MEYHGDDIRYYYNREKPKYYPYENLVIRSKRAKRANDRILKYANIIITHDEELRKHIPHWNLYITPLRIDITKYTPSFPEVHTEKVVIVHAPSNYVLKGSKHVIKSIDKLKDKYNIEFILVEHKSQKDAFEIYRKADIIIDQLYAQTYGVFAVEAMAMGKPVVGYISDSIRRTFPVTMPIVSATIDNLTEILEVLIGDGNTRRQLGIEGRRYVEEYHDYRKVAMVQRDIYMEKIAPMSTLESFEYTSMKVIQE